ncbi:MAG: DUF4097 family beta strand repeat-containing protein [Bacteroidales bacterium]|jgi:hypothetical protein|nr:DUF4097 family beta strand repeat-containing protein [Bacteroidales bacterium]
MKTIRSIITVVFVLTLSTGFAQSFKYNIGQSKQIEIKNLVGEINIEEISGSQLIIEGANFPKKPARAEGLKSLYGNGAEDNTEIGLQVLNQGGIIEIQGASKKAEDAKYIFKVPKGVNVKIDYRSPFAKETIRVVNFSNELEISTLNRNLDLKNVTGPVVLNTTNGDINIAFSSINQEAPTSISSINGVVDITLPHSTPAKISLSTINGEIFTNFDINFEKKTKNGLSYIGGGQKINGTINGGGVDIKLSTINDNIYLRKK